MSLPILNKRQIELGLFVMMVAVMILLILAFVYQVIIVDDLLFVIDTTTGHCNASSSTCVGAY